MTDFMKIFTKDNRNVTAVLLFAFFNMVSNSIAIKAERDHPTRENTKLFLTVTLLASLVVLTWTSYRTFQTITST